MAKVACISVSKKSKDPKAVFAAVRRAMEAVSWRKYVKGKKIVLKINAVWDKIYPGCTTTPMVIEGVLKVLLKAGFNLRNITIADTDTAAIMLADKSFALQGISDLAKKYGVSLVNLTNTAFREVKFAGSVLKRLKVSRVLLDADCIISLPVLKTHSYSQMTGALKNQWGCIHDLRHNFHMVLHQAIADVNLFFKPKLKFALMDGLFGMEGKGPKTGSPKKIGYLFASSDLVALDTLAASVMGLEANKIDHLVLAEKAAVGSMKFETIGSKPPRFHFKKAERSNLVMDTEMKLRRLGPLYEKVFFDGRSPFLLVLRWAAKFYYDIWYAAIGKKYADAMMKTNYGAMWKSYFSS